MTAHGVMHDLNSHLGTATLIHLGTAESTINLWEITRKQL